MAVSAKAYLLGSLSTTELRAALSGFEAIEDNSITVSERWLTFSDAAGVQRKLFVSQTDEPSLVPGELTYVNIGVTEPGPALIQALVDRFGGFLNLNDGQSDEWIAVQATHAIEHADPEQMLIVELAAVVGQEAIEKIIPNLFDREKVGRLEEAFARYRERREAMEPSGPSV
ncbi:conserved hypothetical protein [Hyphomicrobiales bacterium]|jgi:hypothetical protein|nr:conserved hypothetical protein [Hyphomicrobiales bacterium]CAH1702584.1 hypothetical protein BOSEA1005_30456 [Hyphomicrobiales bacterium]CAI0346787.1 conserved hypothetical protein [Hyphomicrobiales bacterium]